MPDLIHALRAASRSLRPVSGATANARDAVRRDRQAALARRSAAVVQAHALGPAGWQVREQGAAWPAQERSLHAAHLYADDADLLAQLTGYVADGLTRGEVCLVIATPAHRAGLRARLALHGVVDDEGRLRELDAEQLLQRFLRNGWPDPGLFDLEVAAVVRRVHAEGAPVRAFGEMVGLLQAQGLLLAALQLEKLWEQLQLELGFPLLCAYPLTGSAEQDDDVRERVLAEHTHVVTTAG